jgi:hypothetical protein
MTRFTRRLCSSATASWPVWRSSTGPWGRQRSIEPLACPKDLVTREQLVGVFLDWAKVNPQSMDELPVESLEQATAAQWPCDSRSAAAPLRSASGER